MAALATKIYTFFNGTQVGSDAYGNRYYVAKKQHKPGSLMQQKRWALFKDMAEASRIPPEWHAWLHHTTNEIPTASSHISWIKPHAENLSGTLYAYRPKGHTLKGGKRHKATGDYQAWKPD